VVIEDDKGEMDVDREDVDVILNQDDSVI